MRQRQQREAATRPEGKRERQPKSSSAYSDWRPLLLLLGFLELGDVRLFRRVAKMIRDSLGAAKCSLAALFGRGGSNDLKRAQELLSNDHVEVLDLRNALYATTKTLIAERGIKTVVCIHDPTLLDFSGQDFKGDRMAIGDGGGLGYAWRNCLVVDPASKRLIGVAHQTLVTAKGPDDQSLLDYTAGSRLPERSKERAALARTPQQMFLTHARVVDERLNGFARVHVADREFDDGLSLRSLCQAEDGSRFVIRGLGSRLVQVRPGDVPWLPKSSRHPTPQKKIVGTDGDGLVNVTVADIARRIPVKGFKEVPLDVRGRVCLTDQKKRVAHVAALAVGAVPVRLAKRSARGSRARIREEPVELNLVVVRETNPRRGKKPLLWILLTNLPVGTPDEIAQAAEYYSCRWRTEEFFRTTKDAMKLEASELHDPEATARLLFFVTLKAMFLDDLRYDAAIPAGVPPTPEQQRELVAGAKRADILERQRRNGQGLPELSRQERAVMALGKIACLGGWAGRKGDNLGNYILLRGLPVFLHDVFEGRYAWLVAD